MKRKITTLAAARDGVSCQKMRPFEQGIATEATQSVRWHQDKRRRGKQVIGVALIILIGAVFVFSPAAREQTGGAVASLLAAPFALGLIALYMLPAIIAERRHHRNKLAITVLNLTTGWTALGWIVALVWACTNDKQGTP